VPTAFERRLGRSAAPLAPRWLIDGTKLALVWLFILGSPLWASEVCAAVAPEYLTRYDTGMALHSSAMSVAGMLTLFPSAVAGVARD
jgi:hypothetical protein